MKFQKTILASACAGVLASGSALANQCTAPLAAKVSCDTATVLASAKASGPSSTVLAPFSGVYYGWSWGTTAAQVKANFPPLMYLAFYYNPNVNAMVANMTNDMLAHLSTLMSQEDPIGDYTLYLLRSAAERLTAANLRRLQGAFGLLWLKDVEPWMPAATLQAYNASAAAAPIPLSAYWYATKMKVPPVYAALGWPYEVILDRYTESNEPLQVSLNHAIVWHQSKIKLTPMEAVGYAATAMGICQFFDPACWGDIKTFVKEQATALADAIGSIPDTIGSVVTPYPPAVGYPGGDSVPNPDDSETEMGDGGGGFSLDMSLKDL